MNTENQKLAASPLRPDLDLTVLIPARAGSKRIPGKNTRLLGGKPLIQWTIEAAKAANVARIIVSTDDDEAARIAASLGCHLHARKAEHATDNAPDYLWVNDVLPMVTTPYIAICRPTSPFRTGGTIRRGYAALLGGKAHSIRAVEPVKEHPGKMWAVVGDYMHPVVDGQHADGTPFHSSPTQTLPNIYKQNASLEIAHVASVKAFKTISGQRIAPFFTDTWEGFDLNTEDDWVEAERLAQRLP